VLSPLFISHIHSMKVIDMIKPILCESRMFYDPEKQVMSHDEKRRMNKKKGGLKIGQGGEHAERLS
jgi:tRNA pseudouridine55 synthase